MIAFDASANLGNDTATSLTGSITVGSGVNRILFTSVANFTSDAISGITFDSVPMTQIGASQKLPNNNFWVSLWYLIAPNSGAHNVVITSGSSATMYGTAACYTGVAQTNPIDTSGNASANGAASITKSLTTTVNNCWTIAGIQSSAGTQTATSGSIRQASNAANFNLFDSNAAVTPAGSTTISADFDTNRDGGMVMAAFKPSVSTGGFFNFF